MIRKSELRSYLKVEVAVFGSSSLTVLGCLCGRKATLEKEVDLVRAQDLCESRGGRPGFPVVNVKQHLKLFHCLWGRKATLDVVLIVSVNVRQHLKLSSLSLWT